MDPVRSQVFRSVVRYVLAYCNRPYPVGAGALGDVGTVPLNVWQTGRLEFRVRGADDYPWGDEYPHGPYYSPHFVSRSVLAGYVNGVKKKEFKFTILNEDLGLLSQDKAFSCLIGA